MVTYCSVRSYEDLDSFSQKLKNIYQDDLDSKPVVGQHDEDPRHSFWEEIFNIFHNGKVNFTNTGIKIEDAIKYVAKDKQLQGPNSKEVLLSKAEIVPEIIDELKRKHQAVKNNLPTKLAAPTYKEGSNGIVMIGGSKFTWLSYLSLVSLRNAGSTLPVEIIMPQHDDFVKEKDMCTEYLPRLNAACVVLPDVLGASVMQKWSSRIASYQLKSLALMVSSFQNVLLLDSDNVVVQNPDKLFESKLFKQYGMITWPDYWERTISPVFYDIAGVEVNELKRVRYNRFPLALKDPKKNNIDPSEKDKVPYHDLEGTIPNLSTESGQLLINKGDHACALLLSMYYNMLGPKLYYKLFSLGEQGEGDKDTFPAAAVVCKEKFYQVKAFIRTFGYADDKDKYHGVSMGQKDPLIDFNKYEEFLDKPSKVKENRLLPIDLQIENIRSIMKEHFEQASSRLFTVHCNYPKLDPVLLMDREDIFDPTELRLKYRLYGGLTYDDPNIKDKTLDFEYEQFKNMETLLCEDSLPFVYFEKKDMEMMCKFVKNQVKWLQSNPVV